MTDLTSLRRKLALRFVALRFMHAAARQILTTLRFLRRLAALTGLTVRHALIDVSSAALSF